MNCPTCGNLMQGGYLRSDSAITWLSDAFSDSNHINAIDASSYKLPGLLLQLYANRCLNCKRIEIDLNQIRKSIPSCPKCGNSVEVTATFCSSCGQELQKSSNESQFVCENCNNPIESDDITCPHCGMALGEFENDILNTCVECGYSDPSLEDLAECPKCGALLPI